MVPNIKQALMWSYEVWKEMDPQIICSCWRMSRIIPLTWSANFALDDVREKSMMLKDSEELAFFIGKLQLLSEEMQVDEYIQMDGKDLIEEELTNAELISMALDVAEASPSNLDLNVDPIPNVDDQPPPIVRLSDARHHASMLSHFLLDNPVNFSI